MSKYNPRLLNAAIDATFRGQTARPTDLLVGTLYMCLLTSEPYDAVVGGTETLLFDGSQEVSYSGYARVAIARSLTAWLSTQDNTAVSNGEYGESFMANPVYFGLNSATNVTVTHLAFAVNNTRATTGNLCFAYMTLDEGYEMTSGSPGVYPGLVQRWTSAYID